MSKIGNNGLHGKKRANSAKDRLLRDNYGICEEGYNQILQEQNGTCYICNNTNKRRALCVDHCHTTNKVRGLLCDKCNLALGNFKDSSQWLEKAKEYLQRDYQVPENSHPAHLKSLDDKPLYRQITSTPDGIFASVSEAAIYYSVHDSTIRDWSKKKTIWHVFPKEKISYRDVYNKFDNIISKAPESMPEDYQAQSGKNRVLVSKFGICENVYNQMLAEQADVCWICDQPETSKTDTYEFSLSVDHCHTTGKVRGLLCSGCNTGLGLFNDNISLIEKSIQYLKRDYTPPALSEISDVISHKDRPNWKCLVTSPDKMFASFADAADHYKIHETSIRYRCKNTDGWSSQKKHISYNEAKKIVDDYNKDK